MYAQALPINPDQLLERGFTISQNPAVGYIIVLLLFFLLLAIAAIIYLYRGREQDKDTMLKAQEQTLAGEKKSLEIFNGLLQMLTKIDYSLTTLNTTLTTNHGQALEKFKDLRDEIKDKKVRA